MDAQLPRSQLQMHLSRDLTVSILSNQDNSTIPVIYLDKDEIVNGYEKGILRRHTIEMTLGEFRCLKACIPVVEHYIHFVSSYSV